MEHILIDALTLGLSQVSICLILVTSSWAVYDVHHTTDHLHLGLMVACTIVAVPIVILPLVLYTVREHTRRHRCYSIQDLLHMGAPLAGVISVCILCTFPVDDLDSNPVTDFENAYPTDAYPPAGYPADTYPPGAYPLAVYPSYTGFDYHNPEANNTLPPPMYIEKETSDSVAETVVTAILFLASTFVTIPALYRTVDLVFSHRVLDVMVCTVLALTVKHVVIAGSTTYNQIALAGAVTALLLLCVSVLMRRRQQARRVNGTDEGTTERGTHYACQQQYDEEDTSVTVEEG